MIDNTVLADSSLALDPRHDGRHALNARPLSRESIPYLLNLPEQGIGLFTYTWVNARSEAGAILAIFGPGVGAQPIFDAIADRPVPADMNFSDWRIGALHLMQDLRFDRAHVRWRTDKVDLDLQYEAMHPPYAYGSDARGCMPYAADDRIEQSGRARGTLKLGERVIPFETTGHRDHSWGTRDWLATQHWKWVQAQAGPDVSVHFWLVEAVGRTELRGYVFKEGRMAVVTGVDFKFDYAGALNVERYEARVTDALNRVTTLSAKVFARFEMCPDPACCLNEHAGSAVIDGRPGVSWIEMMWPTDYRKHIGTVGPY
jgi:hypothetical protein